MDRNASGKTTLVKHLNGLLRPNKGRVILDDIDNRQHSVAELSQPGGLCISEPQRPYLRG